MITEEMLDRLREELRGKMSEKRFRHTAEVERMVIRLGELYLPDRIPMLRGAALLHDITKERSAEEQLVLVAREGLTVTKCDLHAPKTFHARTAAVMIREQYPQFADEELISCVRWHTTGRAEMTLSEKLVYLADYIDESRSFPDCVRLRNYFWDARPEQMTEEDRLTHLRRTLILSFEMTVRSLLGEGAPISPDTFEARNALVIEELETRRRP